MDFNYNTTHYINFKKLLQMNSCTTTLDEETVANLKILNQREREHKQRLSDEIKLTEI